MTFLKSHTHSVEIPLKNIFSPQLVEPTDGKAMDMGTNSISSNSVLSSKSQTDVVKFSKMVQNYFWKYQRCSRELLFLKTLLTRMVPPLDVTLAFRPSPPAAIPSSWILLVQQQDGVTPPVHSDVRLLPLHSIGLVFILVVTSWISLHFPLSF